MGTFVKGPVARVSSKSPDLHFNEMNEHAQNGADTGDQSLMGKREKNFHSLPKKWVAHTTITSNALLLCT